MVHFSINQIYIIMNSKGLKLTSNLLSRTYSEFVTSARESWPHNGTNIMDDGFEVLENTVGNRIPYVQVIIMVLL